MPDYKPLEEALDDEGLLDYCETNDRFLSDWEREFIDGCQQRLGERELSERQRETLHRIYTKVREKVGR